MPIKSYVVKEPMLQVVSRDGEALIVKVSDVDVDASIAATKRWLAKLEAERAAEQQAARVKAESRARAATQPRRSGTLQVMASPDIHTPEVQPQRDAPADAGAPAAVDYNARNEQLMSRITELDAEIAKARESLGLLKRSAWNTGLHTIEGQAIIGDMEDLESKHVTPLELELERAREDLVKLHQQARRDGVRLR